MKICCQFSAFVCATICSSGGRCAQIVITQQPQSMTVFETRKARFAVEADAGGASLNYQWQRDGTNIVGATDLVFITDYVLYSDDYRRFRVVISSPGLETVTSQEAMQTVIGWDVPPRMIQAGRRTADSAEIVVVFWSKMSALDATAIFNWSLDGGASVKEVTAGRSEAEYVLTTENLAPGGAYNLTAQRMRDSFGNALSQQTIAVTLASPDPTLSFAAGGNQLKILWRVENYLYDPFDLEFSSNTAKRELWYPTGSVTKDGDLRTCTLDMTGKVGFFRLRRVE